MSQAVSRTGLIDELTQRGLTGLEVDLGRWVQSLKDFQEEIEEMGIINLDQERDLMGSLILHGSSCNSLPLASIPELEPIDAEKVENATGQIRSRNQSGDDRVEGPLADQEIPDATTFEEPLVIDQFGSDLLFISSTDAFGRCQI